MNIFFEFFGSKFTWQLPQSFLPFGLYVCKCMVRRCGRKWCIAHESISSIPWVNNIMFVSEIETTKRKQHDWHCRSAKKLRCDYSLKYFVAPYSTHDCFSTLDYLVFSFHLFSFSSTFIFTIDISHLLDTFLTALYRVRWIPGLSSNFNDIVAVLVVFLYLFIFFFSARQIQRAQWMFVHLCAFVFHVDVELHFARY